MRYTRPAAAIKTKGGAINDKSILEAKKEEEMS
jgi:hypothetical protein